MNIQLLLDAGAVVVVHAVCALIAFVLGMAVLFRRKGGWVHKLSGRVWVGLMVVVCLSSFFINEIRMIGPFSPIHGLSIYTLAGLAASIWAIRHKNIKAHKRGMQQAFFFGLIVAGGFTFLPNRLLAHVMGDGLMAKIAPVIWVLVPLTVYLIYRAQTKNDARFIA